MLVANHLYKRFKVKETKNQNGKKAHNNRTIEAVQDVSITIEQGKIIGLLGVNGAGKTTTIKMLSTLLRPTSGEIFFDGIDAIKYPFVVKKRINMVAGGDRSCYSRLTARQNLEYFAALYSVPQKESKESIETLIRLVGLEDFVDIPVERYSKGMKQRLQIARGMINDPDIIFFDEPTLGLDIAIARQIQEYVKTLAVDRNKGLLLTTHYIAEAEKLCDYVYLIDKGRIINSGTPKELIDKARLKSKVELELTEIIELKDLECLNEDLFQKFGRGLNLERIFIENQLSFEIEKKRERELMQVLLNSNLPVSNISVKEPMLEDAIIFLTKQ